MPRIVTCKGCGAKKKYYARSLCQACYNKAHHKHYYTEHMTAEEERELLRTQNEALRSEVRQLRRDLAVAVQEVERLNKAVNKMQKVLNAVAKSNRKIG